MFSNYDTLTSWCEDAIAQSMAKAGNSFGAEQRAYREQAWGIFIGWQALARTMPDGAGFESDEKRLRNQLHLDAVAPVSSRSFVRATWPTGRSACAGRFRPR